MISFFAKWRAKRAYRFKLKLEAATNDINAQLAMNRAKEKRAYIEQLNREADDIEANIAKEEATDEYKALAGQEKYEADREKDDAKKIAAEKRRTADEHAKNADEGEKTAQYFRGNADNSRLNKGGTGGTFTNGR
jgi:hypothetical protein